MTNDATKPSKTSSSLDAFLSNQLSKSKEALMQERLKYRNPKSNEAIALNALIKASIRNKAPVNDLSEAKALFRKEYLSLHPQLSRVEDLKRHELIDRYDSAHYAMLLMQTEMLTREIETPLSIKKKRRLAEQLEEGEIIPPIAELTEQHAEIAKTIGELAEKSESFHHLSHLSDTSAATLRSAGGIGAVISGVLALFINGSRCLREKRMPDSFEKAKMTYSAIILSLGILALTGVGGPVAVGAFGASAIFLSFSKTLFELMRDGYRLHTAKSAREASIAERKSLLDDIKSTIAVCQNIKTTLHKSPHHPEAAKLEDQFQRALQRLKTHEEALQSNNKRFAFNVYKHQLLEERQQSTAEKVRKVGILLGGILSVIGAALSLTPLAPIGLALIGTGALLSLCTEGGYRLRQYVRNKTEQQLLAQSEALKVDEKDIDDLLPSINTLPTSDTLVLKKLGALAQDASPTSPSPSTQQEPTEEKITPLKATSKSTTTPNNNDEPDDSESESVHPH